MISASVIPSKRLRLWLLSGGAGNSIIASPTTTADGTLWRSGVQSITRHRWIEIAEWLCNAMFLPRLDKLPRLQKLVVHLVRRFRRSLVFVVGPAPLPSVEKVIANLGSARIAIASQTSRDLSGQIRDPFTLTFCYIGLQKSRRQFKLLGETGIDFLSLSDISHALDAISIGALETLREMGGQNASRAR